MTGHVKYTVFSTDWGYFGLLAEENTPLRTFLPQKNPDDVQKAILTCLPSAQVEPNLLPEVQRQIKAYFGATCVDFNDVLVNFERFSAFSGRVLAECRKISYGQTISYAELAQKTGNPAAIRAVGSALGRNPLPLIIPCHRVICSNGKIGGFSAAGGVGMKERMLRLESKNTTKNKKNSN